MWWGRAKTQRRPARSKWSVASLPGPQPDPSPLRAVIAVQDRHNRALMSVPGVVAVGTGLDETGRAVIHVFTEAKSAPGRLPVDLEGVRVVEFVSGKIVAMKGHGGGGTSHTARQ